MTARDRMLGNIRKALGDGTQGSSFDPPAGLVGPSATQPGRLASQFAESLKALGGDVCFAASAAEAGEVAKKIVDGRPYLASAAPIVAACGFSTPFSREAAASADFGISSADFALADTGSLVFLSESRESRLISLLPPHHIAIVEVSKVVAGIEDLFTRVPRPAELSSSLVIVTGPSRTGDIEMRLVRGVHGPGHVTVILVDDVTHR